MELPESEIFRDLNAAPNGGLNDHERDFELVDVRWDVAITHVALQEVRPVTIIRLGNGHEILIKFQNGYKCYNTLVDAYKKEG